MVTPRSIEDVQKDYFAAMASSGSNLIVDRAEGSLAYTLARASAAVAVGLDNRLALLEENYSLLTATGSRLDDMGGFISAREQSARAAGNVLAISKADPVQIPAGTTLINISTGLQFTTVTTSVTVSDLFESSIRVNAVSTGFESNLVAGTQLYSADYPDVCFRVGNVRTDTYYGDLLGGRPQESDEDYRQRLVGILTSSTLSSTDNLLRKLNEYPLVDRAYVKTRVPGVVEIWVDAASNYSQSQKQELLTYVEPYIAAGVVPSLIQARRHLVDINLTVRPYNVSNKELSDLTDRLTSVITNYILSLDIGQDLQLSLLLQAVSFLARDVTITFPLSDVTVQPTEVVALRDIKYTFNSAYI